MAIVTVVSDVLADLERYYDTAPRAGADAEAVGPFTLFRSRLPWPYYARPRLGLDHDVTAADVRDLLARMDELALPHAVEWVHETTPSLLPAARAAGLEPQQLPLLTLVSPPAVAGLAGLEVRVVDADDPAIEQARAVAHVGFAAEGTSVGVEGTTERDVLVGSSDNAAQAAAVRQLIRSDLSTMAVAIDTTGALGGGVVGSGSLNQRADTGEVVGVATLPAARRRGIAAALTATLVAHALARGITTVFLSADSDDVARVYRRLGFADVGTACIVE